jgi:hypothetical protein
VFGGIAARDSLGTAVNIVVPVGGIAAVMSLVLWWRALLRRHGPGPMLIVLAIVLAILFLLGLILQNRPEAAMLEIDPISTDGSSAAAHHQYLERM